MTIRPATVDDVEQVIPLVGKVAAFHQQRDPSRYSYISNVAERYRNWLTQRATDEQSVFLVAEREAVGGQDARLVGFLVAATERDISIYTINPIGFVHDLWVDEEYRNEGVGRQMVMLAVERFRAIGVRQLRLDVLIDNQPARTLFEACGFRPSTILMLQDVE